MNLLSLGPDSHGAGIVFSFYISEFIIHPERLGHISQYLPDMGVPQSDIFPTVLCHLLSQPQRHLQALGSVYF